jgi:hypothetical protein
VLPISGSHRDRTTSASLCLIDYGRTELILPQPLRTHQTYQHLGTRVTDESEPEFRGAPTVDQCAAVYRSMPEPTVRTFHAKLLAAGYDISLSGAQRFIARHIKKPQPKPYQAPAVVGRPLTLEELSLIQKDLDELQPLDAAALKVMLEK